ncbi:MAG TPA: hypothetical protein VMG58_12155 [Candidatus Sulfotelmatobacter sp.]|nr:hypothetical protein [Candidatus Sulfotelmatobacter sp.]
MLANYHLLMHFTNGAVPDAARLPGVHEARTQAWQNLEKNPSIKFVQVLDDGGMVIETVERVTITD